ncbi:MAG: ribosomal L7Ae/L30e/S12e/Gadd45 family protein [Nanoarchaeota archaeon]|nr:ribosomal L7Ae/L30e/S12e/Gadd45 family protein [Nanoarchaeota archaeon]
MSLQDLKDALKKKSLVFGSNSTIKNLKNGKTEVVFLANDCGKEIEDTISHYAGMANAKIIKLDKPRTEISIFCKKNFSVSVISY